MRDAARAAIAASRIRRPRSLTVVVAGDAALRRLNRDFAGVDAATDVLAFTADETPDYLGEVVISLPRARAQARRGGHRLIDELRLLTIHGVLHLLGHDHQTPGQKRRMWAAQARALRQVGASIDGAAD